MGVENGVPVSGHAICGYVRLSIPPRAREVSTDVEKSHNAPRRKPPGAIEKPREVSSRVRMVGGERSTVLSGDLRL